MVTRAASTWALPLLVVLFFFSGACALVYQVMWQRMLALVFGVTVYAASTVLASFMAGLALGSYAAGRFAATFRSPLRAFGLIEIAVGISAFATQVVLDLVKNLWVAANPSLPTNLAFVTAARFAASFAVLIVPTTLMGATLPVVMQSALVRNRAIGSRMGLLYAINTTGAIVGSLVAGFYFVPELGMAASFRIAAAANLAIGSAAVASSILVSGQRDGSPQETSARDAASVAPGEMQPRAQRAVLWTFALSGLLSLALEIVWFRMLAIFQRPTAYAFTIMLAAVLGGIALGSAVATTMLRRRAPWLAILTVVQLGIGISGALSFNAFTWLQQARDAMAPPITGLLGTDPYLAPILVASLLAMLPTTLLLGFAFPIGLALWTAGSQHAARRIGAFYSLNVFGAIAGSILGGFVLLPLVGSRGSLIASSSLAVFSSVMLALAQWRTRPNFAGFMGIVGPVVFVMCALNAVDPFDIAARTMHRGERILWQKEGVQTTVGVHQRGRMRILYLDGMHQADDDPGSAFVHHRLGALPVMLHRAPHNILVVGLGGGATPGAVARFPGVAVDVVELSAAVVEGSDYFKGINFDVLRRPNVKLRVDDGRNFLLTTRQKYDVVTADIILPRHAGAGALYSKEYFELVRNTLAPGGLALQWNGAATQTPYKLIMRTFMEVFPHTTLWGDGSLMLGSIEPFEFSQSAYERRRQDPAFRALFDWDMDVIGRNYIAGPAELKAWVGEGAVLTDDKPLIEYFLSTPPDDPAVDTRVFKGALHEVLRP